VEILAVRDLREFRARLLCLAAIHEAVDLREARLEVRGVLPQRGRR